MRTLARRVGFHKEPRTLACSASPGRDGDKVAPDGRSPQKHFSEHRRVPTTLWTQL